MAPYAYTENGALSLESTTDPRLDLFFKTVRDLGSYNEPEKNEYLYELIDKSMTTNALDTMKILMNWRDCRGGKGDRQGFLVALAYYAEMYPSWFFTNILLVPEYGSYMDLVKLWHLVDTIPARTAIMKILTDTLRADKDKLIKEEPGISLVAKWIPAERSKWDRYNNNKFLVELCKMMYNKRRIDNAILKELRTDILVPLRKHLRLVESQLCDKKYNEIEYAKVPSVAMNKYKTLFYKNDYIRFTEYLGRVNTGTEKINSDQVYPHDLVRQYLCNHRENPVIEAQWQAIKKKVQETKSFDRSIVVCDVSGSMDGTPMQVAIALGLLGLYENRIITFSERPELVHVPEGSLYNQVKQLNHMHWGMNTNLERVLDLVLGLSAGDPKNAIKRVFIFSDMQFDEACSSNGTHFELMQEKFKRANIEMPQIVFWNLRGSTRDFPVSHNEHGVILMSGYSQSLLNSLLDGKHVTPMDILMNVINSPRYNMVQAPEF